MMLNPQHVVHPKNGKRQTPIIPKALAYEFLTYKASYRKELKQKQRLIAQPVVSLLCPYVVEAKQDNETSKH